MSCLLIFLPGIIVMSLSSMSHVDGHVAVLNLGVEGHSLMLTNMTHCVPSHAFYDEYIDKLMAMLIPLFLIYI